MSTRVPRTHPYIPDSAPQARKAMPAAVGAQDVEEFYADVPAALGRIGRPRDIAQTVAFLVGDAAAFVSGAVIAVDGAGTA